MPRTNECTFCGDEIRPGTGNQYIRNDATVHYFCSNKCRINQQKLKRKARKLKWTLHFEPGKK